MLVHGNQAWRLVVHVLLALIFFPLTGLILPGAGLAIVCGDENSDPLRTDRLLQGVRPLISSLVGRESQFELTGTVHIPISGNVQTVEIQAVRYDNESFDLVLTHQEYAVSLRRRADVTALGLPKHGKVFVGRGEVASADRLSPQKIWERLSSPRSALSTALPIINLLSLGDLDATVRAMLPNARVSYDSKADSWLVHGNATVTVPAPGETTVTVGDTVVKLKVVTKVAVPVAAEHWPGMTVVQLERGELERTLLRGLRRTGEILQPSSLLTSPVAEARDVPHGRLIWVEGQRVALLHGTPEEIGKAHGQLLHEESLRCIESVLYAFGTVNTIRTGTWFRHDLEAAYVRLAPHIPERHKAETKALAVALDLEPRLVEVLNVFPELFHCSGFAVFGSATKDGRLYHGRVLDYMTTIGLQDAATTFVVQATGQIPFVNVGYAGFIGSVSGMNVEAISLGEMGGRGEGQWDGVPMATLMRRALEECRTLEEVKTLWTASPRTCEYYYVFADGKTNEAVGVSATPQMLQFIGPGQSHELLGDGISDAVVLSAGSRLQELRKRVTEKHGQIDEQTGTWLMSRPVAMESNLHNVLFVPADRVLYIANASHKRPAAEMPYVKLDLRELLKSHSVESPQASGP